MTCVPICNAVSIVVICRSRDVKRFVVRLMYLIDIFYSKSHRFVSHDNQRGHTIKSQCNL